MPSAPAVKAVSSWSLHHSLGRFVADDAVPGRPPVMPPSGPVDGLTLLQLPAELARRGFSELQICHFHLPSRDPGYLGELRDALGSAGVGLDALLVDDGDLTRPDGADDDERWIAGWLDDAAELGARRARVIAGKQPPTPERLAESATRLRRLAAGQSGIRLVTENWMALLPSAPEVHSVLGPTEGSVGLLVDLGNWKGPDVYDQLAAVAAVAETCHAKCHTDASGALDTEDYRRKLQLLADAGYVGPLALVHDGPADEWDALEAEYAVVTEVFGAAA